MDLNSTNQVIANRVEQARQARGWSRLQLAERAGISRQNLWELEARGQFPGPQTMTALATALGVDRAWLFYVVPTHGAGAQAQQKAG